MEGVGAAASVIALIEISAKVASLCLDYCKSVFHAKDDIAGICRELINLEQVAYCAKQLFDSANSVNFKTSRQLFVTVQESCSALQALRNEMRPKTLQQALSRLGFQSLK